MSYEATRLVTAAVIKREMGWTHRQYQAARARQLGLWQRLETPNHQYDAVLIEVLRAIRDEPHREITEGPTWLDRYLEEHHATTSP